jgi:phosphatidylglycerol---prolipoprotein diacylglyceryl transferase
MPFTHALDPVLIQLGPIAIRYYSLAYILGFLLAYYALKKARIQGKLNFTDEQLDSFLLTLMIGVVAGARIGHVLSAPTHYATHPLQIFAVWKGGMSFFGGLVGACFAGWRFSKKISISIGKLADVITLPAITALAFGRIANFINGELVGTITNLPWCVYFPVAEGCRHPYQLYASLLLFLFLVFLWRFQKTKRKEGMLFWMFALLMGLARLILDTLREDPRLFGLSLVQYLGFVLVIVSSTVLWKYYLKQPKTKLVQK